MIFVSNVKGLLFPALLILVSFTYAQFVCPIPTGPKDGDTDIAVDAVISWNAIEGVPGFLITVGTTPGGTDIANQRDTGSATSFRPSVGLPEETDIYVTLTLYFFDRPNIQCSGFSFRTENVTDPPICTIPRYPVQGLTNVDISSTISWNYAPRATGYRLTLGTFTGANNILDGEEIIRVAFYDPTTDLPSGTEIFAEIVPFNENGNAAGPCTTFSFTTGEPDVLPACTFLTSPADGAVNVSLNTLLEWRPVLEASGYMVSIGSSPSQNDILDNAIFDTTASPVIDFEPDTTFFATVIPFNSAGDAIGCSQTTFSTIIGCGPFMDEATGELVSISPTIDLPETINICENELPYSVPSKDNAEGYRWFKINSDGSEILLSDTLEVALTEVGNYRYEAYNTILLTGSTMECAVSQEFKLLTSELADISKLDVKGENGSIRITVLTEGTGEYEYALDNSEGPYQDSNVFKNLDIVTHIVYLREKNGCGVASETFVPNLTAKGFPRFFTPNGDGVNDYWQFIPPTNKENLNMDTIFIFDRYGNPLGQLNQNTRGWDGNYNGKSMPESDYWFRAVAVNGEKFNGHFTLKR